jgi:ABC-2 type transport system permease protein
MADALTVGWHQYRLERRMFWRNPTAAFFNFLFPLILLGLFGAVFASHQRQLDVIVPGIAGMSVMTTTFTALAHNVTYLREEGVLKRMRGTPLPAGVYLGALAANAVTNGAVGVVCFASLGVAMSHAIPNFESAPAYVNAVFLPTIFISGVFYDVKHTPAFLRDIAEALPLKHLIDGLSGAMVTGRGLSSNLTAFAVVALWAVAGVALAVRGFSWESKRA